MIRLRTNLDNVVGFGMKKSLILPIMGIVAIALVTGTALGSIAFPMTQTETTTQTNSLTNRNSGLHELRFNQSSPCSFPLYFIPWAVTLNGEFTIVEPPRSNFTECCTASGSLANYSSIVFSVPNGNYTFLTNGPQFIPKSGAVTVNGKDVTVILQVELASCGSTTTSSR